MVRGGWCAGLVLVSLVGCGELESAHTPIWIDPPEGECSDLTRALARAQGREFFACGTEGMRFLNVVPLDDGHVMVWAPASGEGTLWQLDAKKRFHRAPLSSSIFDGIRKNHVLATLPGGLVFDYENQFGTLRIWKANHAARGTDPLLHTSLAPPALEHPARGILPVPLDSAHMLEVRSGDGTYGVARVGEGFERFDGVGQNAYFRRGHRLVGLGAQRLLEWEPLTHSYRIWSYDTARLPADPFDSVPIAEGTRPPDLTRENEFLVLAEDQIGMWRRDLGVLEVRELDPRASDPLAGAVLAELSDERFLSPFPAADQATSSEIRRLVILFQDGRSFDSTFGDYCEAPPGSAPGCGSGPGCCEATPGTLVGTACAPAGGAGSKYHALAREGALADRYFASSDDSALANLLFFQFGGVGTTDLDTPLNSLGELLAEDRIPYALYMSRSKLESEQTRAPAYYDGSWGFFRTLDEFAYDLDTNQLPQISIIVPDNTPMSEAPGEGRSIAAGVEFTDSVARGVMDAPSYQRDTVVLITHLTSGGCSDPVPVPSDPDAPPDSAKYGRRVPLLALGPFVRRNAVSHVPLEHVSLTAFVEWNFLGPERVGALQGRDGSVNNLGSLFDPAALSVTIPSIRQSDPELH
jgi:hypothetical protein